MLHERKAIVAALNNLAEAAKSENRVGYARFADKLTFLDRTGTLWLSGALIGKVGSVFTSTATQHGGQETTITSFHSTLLHHGMVIVDVPYSCQQLLNMNEITGGSPYGAGTLAGGTVVFTNERYATLKFTKDGKEIWAQVDSAWTAGYQIHIIEKAGMEQEIVASAEAFSNDLKDTGHAAVYGIYFDTGQSVVKPESEPALEQIAKLLKGDPSLKVNVVGHTDNVGTIEANMKLSQARATAVVAALTAKYGIAATRLNAYGVGPLAPVATNKTYDGKAKNRRVELVEQ